MFKRNFWPSNEISKWARSVPYRVTIRAYIQSRVSKTAQRVAQCTPTKHLTYHGYSFLSTHSKGEVKIFKRDQWSRVKSSFIPTGTKFRIIIQELQSDYTHILSPEKLPAEKDVETLLVKCIDKVQHLTLHVPEPISRKAEPTSVLMALDNSNPEQENCKTPTELLQTIRSISDIAHSIIKHPMVFISPRILKLYVTVQAASSRSETLPEAFRLYSQKPVPLKDTSPIRFHKPNSNIYTNAIPPDIAKMALEVAIKTKQLVVAIDLIEAAYTNRAFKVSKFIRKALLPALAFTITPFATYTIASQLSNWQTSMDSNMATNVIFTGIMAYIGLTGTIGFIAISTSNDQMDRVTWAPGVPLRQRWMREDERAAIDLVAGAWGFRETWRRGEEEGEEWDLIKEWVSRRAMILDRVELMEGMN
ncbi:hypothetical protein GcM1_248062 [Golovinomyces cichoracearum]|uniref:Uncharacterized protein n=1 Tax=Golovinomyces cichoracearum TaxID=62708 RepID=A0A420ICQ5_9PEZI|nr:hypothetical protein GcM1_248062 [Golovinomyces cichoracearum]